MRVTVLVLGLALCAGCGLFDPTSPEPPGQNRPVPTNYSHPDSALNTIDLAVEAKGSTNAASAYTRAFADSDGVSADGVDFHAFVSNEILEQFCNPFTPRCETATHWDFDQEAIFYGSLIRLYDYPFSVEFTKDDPNPDEPGDDLWILHRKYVIRAHPTSGPIVVATGFADLYFVKAASSVNRWVIHRWEDRRDPNADSSLPTWGERRVRSQ